MDLKEQNRKLRAQVLELDQQKEEVLCNRGLLRRILGVKMSTCKIALYGDTGRYPLHLYVVISMLKYIFHIQNADKNSLVKEIFMDQFKLYQLGFNSHISRILHNLK